VVGMRPSTYRGSFGRALPNGFIKQRFEPLERSLAHA
jgi:hypothetical protein